jgi:large subunit ribosomal protein L7e
LIYKRGYGKVDKQRVPLSNNQVIEQALGKYDILSVEDLVHEIFTVGPNFKQARSYHLYASAFTEDCCRFPTSCGPSSSPTLPVAGGQRKFKHYVQGGDFGNREANINKLVRQMN